MRDWAGEDVEREGRGLDCGKRVLLDERRIGGRGCGMFVGLGSVF